MARRPSFDGTRQEHVLRALLKEREKDLTEVAGELGLSYPQFWRYVSGAVPLRSDQFQPFAQALGISEARLIRALFPSVSEPAWSARTTLEAAGLPPDLVTRIVDDISEWGELDQRAAVEAHIELHREKQTERQSATA